MNGEGCWSTVVCRPAERAALGLASESEWLLQCRLGIGHAGNHATDASVRPRHDRRLWLEWNDFDNRAQSLIERNPCPVPSPEGAHCVFFAGHGGPHFYARSNGHVPPAMAAPRQAPGPQTGGYPTASPPTGPQLAPPGQYPPPARTGAHHFPEPPRAQQQPTASPPSPDSSGATAYRGGRRSTNAEPPVPGYSEHQEPAAQHEAASHGPDVDGGAVAATDYQGRRRRPESADTVAVGDVALADGDRGAELGAALDEVVVALSKLAEVLRRG